MMVRRRKGVYRVAHSNAIYRLDGMNDEVANDVIDATVTLYLSRITRHSVTSDKPRKFRVDQVALIRIPNSIDPTRIPTILHLLRLYVTKIED